MSIKENVIENIKDLKYQFKIKNYDVIGEATQMKGQKIRRIVRGQQSPKITEIEAIAAFFKVTPIDLLTRKNKL